MHLFYVLFGFVSYLAFIIFSILQIISLAKIDPYSQNKFIKYRSLAAGALATSIILAIVDMLLWIRSDYIERLNYIAISSIILFILGYELTLRIVKTPMQVKNTAKTKIIVTHAGTFHADDVFSAALYNLKQGLLEETPHVNVIRVNNANEIPKNNDLVFDIGGGKFDHHQGDDEYHHDWHGQEIPYASFGLLWDKFGHEIIRNYTENNSKINDNDREKIFAKFRDSLVIPIDANDNGIFDNNFNISDFISDLNDDSSSTNAFKVAQGIAFTVIIRRLTKLINKQMLSNFLVNYADFITPEVAVLPKHGPWGDLAKAHPELKLVIYESNRGGYNINTVSDRLDDGSFIDRIKIPQSAINLPGATFVHKAGFIMTLDTLKNATNAAKELTKSED